MSFSPQTLDFLFLNKIHDDRQWFNERRDEYEALVLEPIRQLVVELTPVMKEIDSEFICEPKVTKTISRIFRDTRYSVDKSIFRDSMWITFRRDKKLYNGSPEMFFEISPEGFVLGTGYYKTKPEVMTEIRQMVLSKDKIFLKANKALDKNNDFILDGEKLGKSKFEEQPEDMRKWLDLKSVCVIKKSNDFELLFSNRLSLYLADAFRSLAPIYNLFIEAEIKVKNRM